MALAWWLLPCLPFPGLLHIYFLFTVGLRIFPVCRNEYFRNCYLSFYWKKWFYIWYMALAWWLVPCLPFPGLPHIYFLFTMRLTNERVRVFLGRCSMQHLVVSKLYQSIYWTDTIFKLKMRIKSIQKILAVLQYPHLIEASTWIDFVTVWLHSLFDSSQNVSHMYTKLLCWKVEAIVVLVKHSIQWWD